jgi:hypothetical protein
VLDELREMPKDHSAVYRRNAALLLKRLFNEYGVLDMRSLFAILVFTAVATRLLAAEPADGFRTKFDTEVTPSQPLISTRVEHPPVIDGEVDREPVWQTCSRTHGAWVQIATQKPSRVQCVVYSCFDDKAIYFAFVCEEPDLQNTRMDGNLLADDCVEALLEVGGVNGDGAVYSFRANRKARYQAWGLAPISNGHVPVWQSAGKFGPNRWTVEMMIPFAQLKRKTNQQGLLNPLRGDALGLKLVRYGRMTQDPLQRMVSTWNTEVAFPNICIAGSNRLLFFEDSNILRDADFSKIRKDSAWKTGGAGTEMHPGFMIKKGGSISQTVAVRPNSFYLIAIESDDALKLLVDGTKLESSQGRAGFWSGPSQTAAELSIEAIEKSQIKSIRMEYQPGEEPPGHYCLTNNYRRNERNINAILPNVPEGKYHYRELDYRDEIIGDKNPAIKIGGHWDYDLRVEDLGGREGWIPFSKGSLTGKPEPIFWQTYNPKACGPTINCAGRHQQIVIDIDLGQEYFARGIDVLLPGANLTNLEVWGKVSENQEWTLLHTGDGEFVEPSRQQRHRRPYESIRGIDSVVRFLRWRATGPGPCHGDYPQMDGIQEFWVWGEPKGTHQGIKPFARWFPDEKVPAVKWTTPVLADAPILIVPRPRTLIQEPGWFLIDTKTTIVAQDHPETQRVAKQIQKEIQERWQLSPTIVSDEKGAAQTGGNYIFLGLPKSNSGAAQRVIAEGLDLQPDKLQGYALRVTPEKIVILGNDSDGLYYGVQSMMMAMRWRNDPAGGAPGVPCMKILDWPGTVLQRGIQDRRPYPVMLEMPETEIERVKRLCHLLSRFKFNVIYLGSRLDISRVSNWSAGTLAKLCREMREEYRIEIRPTILHEEFEGGSYWMMLSQDTPGIRESNPDENPEELSGKSLNLCPLNPETYQRHFARIDQTLEEFGYPSKVWMFGQAYVAESTGSRWAQCRCCQRSGLSSEDLYQIFVNRIADHLALRKTAGLLGCQWVRFGDRTAADRRLISIDPQHLPDSLEYELPADINANARPLLNAMFDPSRTASGPADWPSGERFVLGPPQCETEILHGLAGSEISLLKKRPLADHVEAMWYSPEPPPEGSFDRTDLGAYVNAWWYHREFPAWLPGERPKFFKLDLRPFVNHTSQATNRERLEAGRPPEIDLRYLPTGTQTLSGVPFDIIDPATNNGKALLMLGRPKPPILPSVAEGISEKTGPIPVGKRLASLAFLRTQWFCGTGGPLYWADTWLHPTCRVVYDDDTWLVVDSFLFSHVGYYRERWNTNDSGTGMHYRLGWQGNSPTGDKVTLHVVEWVNPYPDRVIKNLEYFTPAFEGPTGKRVNDHMEATVAITGVETTPRDVAFWETKSDRSPRLPSAKPSLGGIEIQPKRSAPTNSTWNVSAVAAGDSVNYRLEPSDGAQCHSGPYYLTNQSRYDFVYCPLDFRDFSATITFEKPISLQRIELQGPVSFGGPNFAAFAARTKKIDVTVEFSEDNQTWRKAGERRGLSADADFLPVELPATSLKSLRLTGRASPYSQHYAPVQVRGDMFWPELPHWNPHFYWRIFTKEK